MEFLGGIRDSTDSRNILEIDSLARFAVDEHNKQQNALLEFGRVVNAREQVVTCTLHHLTLEAIDGGKKKIYKANVWVKPWLNNFNELQEFKHIGDSPTSTPSGLGVVEASLDSTAKTGNSYGGDWQEEVYQQIKAMKDMYLPQLSEMCQKVASKLHQHDSLPQQPKNDQLEKLRIFKTMLERLITFLQLPKSNILPGHKVKLSSYEKQITSILNANRPRKPVGPMQQGQTLPPGWQSVLVHDHVVQDAANHALKTIQQRSNSLFPYKLREIIHAKAEVVEESAKFDLLLKVQRGDKEEKFKVEVHKKDNGAFHLNHMSPDYS